MSSLLSTFTKLFISFTFFRSSTVVRTATWIESICFRVGRDEAGFSGPFSRARCFPFTFAERKRDGDKPQMT